MADNKVSVVKTVENAVLYSDGTIMLKNVRCSYPHLFSAQVNTNDQGETTETYAVTGLMDKKTHEAAKDLCVEVMKGLLKDKGERGAPLKLPADKKFIKDGDPKDEDDAGKPENAGMWVVSTRETKRPFLLDNVKDKATGKVRRLSESTDKDRIYGGCYINMLIRPWFQSNKYGKRVNAGISSVQFFRDGPPFGTGRINDDDVDDRFSDGLEDDNAEYDPSDDL